MCPHGPSTRIRLLTTRACAPRTRQFGLQVYSTVYSSACHPHDICVDDEQLLTRSRCGLRFASSCGTSSPRPLRPSMRLSLGSQAMKTAEVPLILTTSSLPFGGTKTLGIILNGRQSPSSRCTGADIGNCAETCTHKRLVNFEASRSSRFRRNSGVSKAKSGVSIWTFPFAISRWTRARIS